MNKRPVPSSETINKPSDEATPGSPQSGENLCGRCSGSGKLADGPCLDCRGTGQVTVLVGDA